MKLEINNKRKLKNSQMCGNRTHLKKPPKNNEEITKKIRNYLQSNENENITYQNLQDAVQRGIFTAVNVYIKKERSHINNLTLHLKGLEKNKLSPKLAEGRKY